MQACRAAGVAPHVAEVNGRKVPGFHVRTKKQATRLAAASANASKRSLAGQIAGSLRRTRYREASGPVG